MKRIFWSIAVSGSLAYHAFAQPDWTTLERYQGTITAESFTRLANELYAPDGALIPYLAFRDNQVLVYSTPAQNTKPLLTLDFAVSEAGSVRTPKTLTGLRIALDPGHIGGAWSRMEERFFLMDRERDWPVQEAALNLYVARLIRDRLAGAGAEVVLVKDDFEPLTTSRPDALMLSAANLPPPDARFAHLPELFSMSSRLDAMRKNRERQFYRTDEIAARANLINHEIKPDLTLCIHFNATGFGDEKKLYDENGLAFFVHGNYRPDELEDDAQKYFLLSKLLEHSHEIERGVAESIASRFAETTGLPPAYNVSPGGVMHPIGTNQYLYARNLAANRQFRGPVVFLEPYFMNNRIVYMRIQAGDYDGMREFEGTLYPSIFREYADAVAAGVISYYNKL